jgi:hypothetical protein
MRTQPKYPLRFLVNDADVSGPVTITAMAGLDGTTTFLLTSSLGCVSVSSTSGKALARYAFEHGADSVRHSYDLSLEPEL